MNLLGTLHQLDDSRGAVRVEDVYDTDIDDLWESCTDPDRLARWIAEVSGDLHAGGTVEVVFTSTWAGPGTDRRLRRTAPPADDHAAGHGRGDPGRGLAHCRGFAVPARGGGARSSGRPAALLRVGWQAHLEDLCASLAGEDPVHPDGFSAERAATAWHARWTELTATYEHAPVA